MKTLDLFEQTLQRTIEYELDHIGYNRQDERHLEVYTRYESGIFNSLDVIMLVKSFPDLACYITSEEGVVILKIHS